MHAFWSANIDHASSSTNHPIESPHVRLPLAFPGIFSLKPGFPYPQPPLGCPQVLPKSLTFSGLNGNPHLNTKQKSGKGLAGSQVWSRTATPRLAQAQLRRRLLQQGVQQLRQAPPRLQPRPMGALVWLARQANEKGKDPDTKTIRICFLL